MGAESRRNADDNPTQDGGQNFLSDMIQDGGPHRIDPAAEARGFNFKCVNLGGCNADLSSESALALP
jgi:hypothetical protein